MKVTVDFADLISSLLAQQPPREVHHGPLRDLGHPRDAKLWKMYDFFGVQNSILSCEFFLQNKFSGHKITLTYVSIISMLHLLKFSTHLKIIIESFFTSLRYFVILFFAFLPNYSSLPEWINLNPFSYKILFLHCL